MMKIAGETWMAADVQIIFGLSQDRDIARHGRRGKNMFASHAMPADEHWKAGDVRKEN